VEKYDPTYNVVFRMFKTKDATQLEHITTKKSFANWFDAEGTFVKKPFDNWLGVNVIGVEVLLTSGKKTN
jgi:Microsomal signal peptidase 25 kDa subunit (SPC25)